MYIMNSTNGIDLISPKSAILVGEFQPETVHTSESVVASTNNDQYNFFADDECKPDMSSPGKFICDKKYQTDYLVQFYVSSLTIIGLFILYRALHR